MTGIVITGHGSFATGIESGVRLLAGCLDFIKSVDFESSHSEDQLKRNLRAAFAALEKCDRIVVLSDILGGSPFKMAVTLSFGSDRIRVICGTNLGMAVELALRCMTGADQEMDLDELTDQVISVGKGQIDRYRFVVAAEEESEDGI